MSALRYRPEIDGLRAVAVVPILLYHAGYNWIPGGFIGVDIFFVISGYLIGSIITGQIAEGRFTYREFYHRRIRRIFPALLVVLLFTLAGGYFVLLPNEYMALAKSTLAAMTFVPNIYLWAESSTYFGLDVATRPLLHTWSLGIEEQFYILLPPLLLLLHRLRARPMAIILTLIALLSFYCNLRMLPTDANFSFYMLPARAWELLVGVLLVPVVQQLLLQRWLAQAVSLVGLALCVVPMFLLTERSVFPGVNAVYPVLGAALIILGTTHPETLVGKLLASRWPVDIGKISYSLYLWHWPIAVYATLRWPDSVWVTPAVIASSLLMATLSYHFVEERYRGMGDVQRPVASLKELFALAGAVTLALTAVLAAEGALGRIPEKSLAFEGAQATGRVSGNCVALMDETQLSNMVCQLGKRDAIPTFALWGDSHANALAPALHQAAQELGTAGVLLQGSGCRPLAGVYRAGKASCREFNDAALDYLDAHPDIATVYLAGYWRVPLTGQGYDNSNFMIMDDSTTSRSAAENEAVFRRGLQRTADALPGRKVVLVEDVPEVGRQFGKSVASHFVRRDWLGTPLNTEKAYMIRDDDYARIFRSIVDELEPNLFYLPLQEHLCESGRCPLMRDGRLLYQDGDHLSLFGSLTLAPVFVADLRQ